MSKTRKIILNTKEIDIEDYIFPPNGMSPEAMELVSLLDKTIAYSDD